MDKLGELVGDGFLREAHVILGRPASLRLMVVQEMEQPPRRCQVTFDDIQAFQLLHGHPETVLFDIEVVDAASFVLDHRSEFEAGMRHHWPFRLGSFEELPARLEGFLGFEVRSKTGTEGWVVAKSARIEAIDLAGNVGSVLAIVSRVPPP